jgi:hypothetical protein
MSDTMPVPVTEFIELAKEQLVLVEGVLREALDHEDRIRSALQALSNVRDELDAATRVATSKTKGGG